MIQIIPAILATSEEDYIADLKRIEDSHMFEGGWVHIDLADNKFVQNQTIGPEIITRNPTNLKIELHLMVENPQEVMKKLEGMDIGRTITHIEVGNTNSSLALNPETPASALKGAQVETVLVMGVHPGKQGQEFIPDVLEKIKQIKKMNPKVLVGVDGGVAPENAKLIVDAGADYLVVGSHLIEGEIDENLEAFWEKIKG
jgi:ribulose-phosphate 3-epimerase